MAGMATIWLVKYDQGLAGPCLSAGKLGKQQWAWAVQKVEVF
jgi:hypothetical protein